MTSLLRRVFLASISSSALAGCYAPGAEVSLSPDLERSSLRTVAVRPFADRGHLPAAGVTVSRASADSGASSDEGWSPDAWRRVHEETGVDAVLTGTVTASELVPGGMPPYLIECAFRLVEASGGEVLASGNANEDGGSTTSTASQLARRVLGRFFAEKLAEPAPARWSP